MEIYGTDGTLSASSVEMVQYGNVQLQAQKDQVNPCSRWKCLHACPWPSRDRSSGRSLQRRPALSTHGDAIRNGGEAQPDFDTAVARHRFLDLLQQSSDEGRKVKVK